MKKRICMMTFVLLVGLCSGCGNSGTAGSTPGPESIPSPVEEQTSLGSTETEEQSNVADIENKEIKWKNEPEIDFTVDYSENIKADVDCVVSNSESTKRTGEYGEDYPKIHSFSRGSSNSGRNEYLIQMVFCNMGYGIK